MNAVRVLVLWSPDWPVTAAARAARVPAHRPAAVFVAGRVMACSAVARAQGVRRGLRRREAQARCPDLAVLAPDDDRDARAFEPVVAAVEELAPGVEIVRPGLVALPARGPSGWFGGEQAAAERLVDQVAAATGVESQVGFADGLFGAVLAARRAVAVAPGDTPAFLASLGIEELARDPGLTGGVDRTELVDLLRRLGLLSLGAFAALDAADVASRFGADAELCHRLARGRDPRPPARRRPPEELTVALELDPPVDRIDAAAFAARGLAERLHATLAGHGLSCTRLGVAARTAAGEELHRVWRCAGPLTPSGTVDRVRWQLDAWLTARARAGADGGSLVRLWLVPEETVAAGALQRGLWGETGEADERAGRALVRVQALLGPAAVATAVLGGGRDPAERVRLVPWGDPRDAEETPPSRRVDPYGAQETAPSSHVDTDDGRAGASGSHVAPEGGRDLAPSRHEEPCGGRAGPSGSHVEPDGGRAGAVGRHMAPEGGRDLAPGRHEEPCGGRAGPSGSHVEPEGGEGAVPDSLVETSGGERAPEVDTSPRLEGVAPAGWPEDVRRKAGLSSPVPPRPEGGSSRRRVPVHRSPRPAAGPELPASWPGRLPAPSPAVVPPEPLPTAVTDAAGGPVRLAEPDRLSAAPAHVVVDGHPPATVTAWAGPWPVHQRWWAPGVHPDARMQVVLDDGTALLLMHRDGRWWVAGIYD